MEDDRVWCMLVAQWETTPPTPPGMAAVLSTTTFGTFVREFSPLEAWVGQTERSGGGMVWRPLNVSGTGATQLSRICEYHGSCCGYGDRIDQMEDRRIGPDRHDLSLPSGRDDHPNLQRHTAAQMTT